VGGRLTPSSRCDVVATNDLKAASQLALSRVERALRHDDQWSRLLKGNLSGETSRSVAAAVTGAKLVAWRGHAQRHGRVNRRGFRDVIGLYAV